MATTIELAGKVPPQSLEAERAVLGAILIEPNLLPRAVELLIPEEFYKEAHRKIFAAMIQLFERGEAPDTIMPLVVLRSPYRSVTGPLLDYLDLLKRQAPREMITIVLPEFVPARWWHHLLHNQRALLIKGALLFRRNVVVTSVPYHLSD